MFFIRVKGHGLTTIMIQGLFALTAIVMGMFQEHLVWGIPIVKDIFPALCVEAGLLLSLPFIYLLQKSIDKKGGTAEHSVYGHRPMKWGIISCAFVAAISIIGAVIIFLT